MNPNESLNVGAPITERPALDDVEAAVMRRYGAGARRAEPCLRTPIEYDPRFLEALPREIIEKDYGCGDPSVYVGEGESVVDLGSGAGKICYILSQKVGPKGFVTGVDFNDEMLALSRKYIGYVADRVGYGNVRFVKARIQDLALDLDAAQGWLDASPVRSVDQLAAFEAECDRLRRKQPLVPDSSVDVVVSNCVLNLVRPQDKPKLFAEIFRVLRPGGRAVIADITCDEDPTPAMKADPDLWSGCIAGAFREDRFLEIFARAGFYGMEILSRRAEPWRVIEGVEFRAATVRAFKGEGEPCLERNHAVIYKGPWKSVCDDDGHTLHRGQRTAVCDKTFSILTEPPGPYCRDVAPVPPREAVPLDEVVPFDRERNAVRHPRETKGMDYRETTANDSACCSSCE